MAYTTSVQALRRTTQQTRRGMGASATATGAAIGTIIPGVGTGVGAIGGTILGSLFGHHNQYPNGNPADLATMDRMAQAGDLVTLRAIAQGATIPGGQPLGRGWPTNPGEQINFGEANAGRAAERQYAAALVNGINALTSGVTGSVVAAPQGAGAPTPGMVDQAVSALQTAVIQGQIPADTLRQVSALASTVSQKAANVAQATGGASVIQTFRESIAKMPIWVPFAAVGALVFMVTKMRSRR